jgi:hypothetical protein
MESVEEPPATAVPGFCHRSAAGFPWVVPVAEAEAGAREVQELTAEGLVDLPPLGPRPLRLPEVAAAEGDLQAATEVTVVAVSLLFVLLSVAPLLV